MKINLLYGRGEIGLDVPDDSIVYRSSFPAPGGSDSETVMESVRNPVGSKSLTDLLKNSRKDRVAIVVSDITRPIPYSRFLPELMAEIEGAGVARRNITIIIATGMHRPSTAQERVEMFGRAVVDNYRIIDHMAEVESELAELPGKSWSGSRVKICRKFAEADFKILTGLVEPHFMAGFSGGRKAVCPGLASLETVSKFHGYEFLSNPAACNGNLTGNPCHLEAVSIAKLARVDFSVNVVLNNERKLVRVFSGGLEEAHSAACKFVSGYSCPKVEIEADIAVTSCGGYPLDSTFYQCVKGMVSCLPAVKRNGVIISGGSCQEGIGSLEYREIMEKYSGKWREFLEVIRDPAAVFTKDQWMLQMQARVLEKIGREKLYFITHGLSGQAVDRLSVNGISGVQNTIDKSVRKALEFCLRNGGRVAVFPEGPYCGVTAGEL